MMVSGKKKMKVVVNGEEMSELILLDKGYEINGELYYWDLKTLPDGRFHIILEGRNHLGYIIYADYDKKTFHIRLNSTIYKIQLYDQFDGLLKKLGMTEDQSISVKTVKAPMPGMIVKILVQEGDQIIQGDPIVILKAMKMENIIKAPGRGIIQKVLVKKNDTVEKNQELVHF